MIRSPELPFLPGYVFYANTAQGRYPKPHHFEFMGDIPMLAQNERPAHVTAPYNSAKRYPSLYLRGDTAVLPPWIAYDKQILKFDAFFQETLQEISGSAFQIREVKILFFLEDGTVMIHEPAVDNSGMSGGTLVRRQRIPFPPPKQNYFYDIIDFNISKEVDIYGRVYKITNCDNFTRNFLNRCGIAVPDPVNTPEYPYRTTRALEHTYHFPKKLKSKYDTLGSFLKFDRQVLRFWGYWDDRGSEFGKVHNLEIHYFLTDGTLEIKDIIPPNAGCDTGPMFLKKIRLPKLFKGLSGIGETTPISLLNVLTGGNGMRYIEDPLNCGASDTEFYSEQDLCIGAELNVFGRKVVLTDCDPFTKEFYRVKYGIDNFEKVKTPTDDERCISKSNDTEELPPWNGFGTHEDSEINCRSLMLKPPRKNFHEFVEKERQGYDGYKLRFTSKLVSKNEEDQDRFFIVNYFVADQTISVFEMVCRNSGHTGGQFLKRTAVPKPGQNKFGVERPKLYGPNDIYVGAELNIHGYTFKLLDADEYCFRYMELHKDEFPKADINLILHKIREALRPIYREFIIEHIPKDGEPIIYVDALRYALCANMEEPLTEHEIITIQRQFQPPCSYVRFSRNDIRQIVLTQLKRGLWQDLDRFKEYLEQMDPERTGKLPQSDCYNLIRSARLPLDIEIINSMFKVLCKDENCNIIYSDLVNFVDHTYQPLPDVPPENFKQKLSWASEREPKRTGKIDWCLLNKALGLEETIPLPPKLPEEL